MNPFEAINAFTEPSPNGGVSINILGIIECLVLALKLSETTGEKFPMLADVHGKIDEVYSEMKVKTSFTNTN